MTALTDLTPSMLDRIRHDLVGLKMPRALEALDQIVRRLEHAEISALEAIDTLLSEERNHPPSTAALIWHGCLAATWLSYQA
jgi:hypothetical protein